MTGVTKENASQQSTLAYAYDADGRQSNAENDWQTQPFPCGDTTCTDSGTGTYTRQYDAENHVIGQTYSTWDTYGGSINCPATWSYYDEQKGWESASNQVTVTLSYKWGPNGHVVEAGNNSSGTMQYEAIHWDGNAVLFRSDASGGVTLWLGSDATLGATGTSVGTPVFISRDFTGAEGDPPNPSRQLCGGGSGAPALWQPGPDGITDGYNLFQGVRSYDPVIGTWSSPDAYQGEAGDPMSQHAYMWNRNNSFLYADPSGYDPGFGGYWVIGMLNEAQSRTSWSSQLSDSVAQIVPFAEAVLDAMEADADTLSTDITDEAWEVGDKGLDDAYRAHGKELGMSESSYAARPGQLILSSLRPGGAPAVIGALGRLYVYDKARSAIAIFGTKGVLTIENYFPASYNYFLEQGAMLYPSEVRELITGLLSR